MKKLAAAAVIDPDVQVKLDAIPDDKKAKAWDGRRKAVTAFKKAVLDHGLNIQEERCVWCTLLVGPRGRRTPHRDHIAPKATYGNWSFVPQNLAIACEYCNGFSVKAELDTVEVANAQYDLASFRIVHPYFDNPPDHIRFEGQEIASGITIKGLTAKGIWTIDKLQLATPGLTEERAKDYLYLREVQKLPDHYKDLFDKATGRS